MKDYFGYEGKKCVVTGASSGMGKATVEMLVDLGAKVYAVDLNECNVNGIEKFIKCNLAKKEEIDNLFNELPEKIDSFFGVAGLSGSKTDYMTTFNCNYTANMYITLKYLSERMGKGGTIAFVTSTAGLNWKSYKKEQKNYNKNCITHKINTICREFCNKSQNLFYYLRPINTINSQKQTFYFLLHSTW